MNYEAFQLLVKSLLNNFKCDSCKEWITQSDINIMSVEWRKITLNINCKKCKKTMLVKSEVIWIDLSKMNLTSSQISMIKNSIKVKNDRNIANTKIREKSINDLGENLKKDSLNAADLFK